MPEVHELKLNNLQPSRAPKSRLDEASFPPPRPHTGGGLHLSPLKIDEIRTLVKQQFSGPQVVIKQKKNGGWTISLRDDSWEKILQALAKKALSEGRTPREKLYLFKYWAEKEMERRLSQVKKQVWKALLVLRQILIARKSPYRPVRQRKVVIAYSRSRQPRRSGRTRAPTDRDSDSEGDESSNSCREVKCRSKVKCAQKLGVDEVYFVNPFNFKERSDFVCATNCQF